MTDDTAKIDPEPRSFLFVPADDQRKLAKVLGSGADAVIVDLEDSVAPDAKAKARQMAAQFLAAHVWNKKRPRLYIRVNDLGTGLTQDDLAAVLPHRPDCVMLPKANSGDDIAAVADMIDATGGDGAEAVGIVAIVTETPQALLQMHSFAQGHARLKGLTWGAEDLSAVLGASAVRDASGQFTPPFAFARTSCQLAASAAGVQQIDGVYADFRDEAGLRREAEEAARDGFSGKLAIHPAQVPVINDAFTPSAEAVAEAQAIVDAFAQKPGAGTVGLGGKMVDRPHLIRAQRLLARSALRD